MTDPVDELGANRKRGWTARLSRLLPLALLILFAAPLLFVSVPAAHAGGGGPTIPVGVLYYVPVTLTNYQPAATSSGFQQQLTVNWNTYSTYLNAGVQNIEFFDSGGTILNGWCESSCSSTATSSTVWVNLGSDTVAAGGGTLTVYMGFLSTSTNNMGNSGTSVWGEAPQLSTTYGQYDDGANVFSIYNNGASLFPLSNTGTGGTAPSTITTSPSPNTHAITASVAGAGGNAAGWSTNGETSTNLPSSFIAQQLVYISGSSPIADILTNVQSISAGQFYAFRFNARSGGTDLIAYYPSGGTSLTGLAASSTGSSTGTWYQMSVINDADSLSLYKLAAPSGGGTNLGSLGTLDAGPVSGKGYTGGGIAVSSDVGTSTDYWTMITVRAYPPGGVMPSASFGPVSTASLTFAPVGGNKVLFYVPVTLTNSQSSATPVNFQEMIAADPSTIGSSYFASNMQNVNWQDGGGNVLASWLESGNTNTATSTVYWVNLDSRTMSAGGGTLTIYLCIYGTSVNAFNAANTGEAPQLSPAYGQYDDGASVFTVYNDFAGTTLPSGWGATAQFTGVVNNGVTITSASAWAGVTQTTPSTYSNVISETYATETAHQAFGIGLSQAEATGGTSWPIANGYGFILDGGGAGSADLVKLSSSTETTLAHTTITTSLNTPYVISGHYSSPNLAEDVNYNSELTASDSAFTSLAYVSLTVYHGASWTVNWVRVRAYPPSGVMPSASFGTVTGVTATAVACSPSTTVDVGSSTTCTATVTGETGSIAGETVTWSQIGGTGSVSFSASTCTLSGSPEGCPVTVTGATVGSATIQASYPGDPGNLASSGTAALTIDAALVVGAPSGTPSTVDQGQTSSLSATLSGGTSPYTCQWLAEAPGAGSFSDFGSAASCTSPGSASFATTGSTTAGAWQFELRVTDGASNTVTSSSGSVTVNTALSVGAITPSGPFIDSGQSVTLTVGWSGGTPTYTVELLSGASSTCSSDTSVAGTTSGLSGTSTTFSVSPTSDTYYCVTVTDSAATPVTVPSPTDLVTVDAALGTPTVTPSATTMDSGQVISVTTSWTGGTANYDVNLYSSSTGTCSSGSTLVSSQTGLASSPASLAGLSPASTLYYCAAVTDGANTPVARTSSAVQVVVNPAFSAGTITPAAPTINAGQSITLTSSPSGGTPPYSYQWYTGAGCTSPVSGATSSTYLASPSSTTTYYVKVTDASGAGPQSACSPGDTVTVNSGLVAGAITPSGPLINPGESITLTASPSGGTPPYSYQWYTGAGCTSPISGATASTYGTGPLTSSVTYYYEVTDSAHSPVSACSSGAFVFVIPAHVETTGGTYMPVGVNFTDGYGHSWDTPGGTVAGDPLVSYFFAGPESNFPPPMMEGWGGIYGTYDGEQGWIVSFF